VTDAGDFIDAALQYEVSPYRYPKDEPDGLRRYGTSVGAIRGTIRDAAKRYPGMTHDDLTALSSELWATPVFERRLAAIVLLQSRIDLLVVTDLTRLEGFIRTARSAEIVERLVADVLAPMREGLDPASAARAEVVIARWAGESDAALATAAKRLGTP